MDGERRGSEMGVKDEAEDSDLAWPQKRGPWELFCSPKPCSTQGGSEVIGLGWGLRHVLKVLRFAAALFTMAKR